MSHVEIASLDGEGSFEAWLAEPEGTPKGAIVVIQEIFGVNEGIRRKADHWASLGYLALAPDLFWRLEPGIELDPDQPEQFQQALGLMQRFDQDKGVADIEATIRAANTCSSPRSPSALEPVSYQTTQATVSLGPVKAMSGSIPLRLGSTFRVGSPVADEPPFSARRSSPTCCQQNRLTLAADDGLKPVHGSPGDACLTPLETKIWG